MRIVACINRIKDKLEAIKMNNPNSSLLKFLENNYDDDDDDDEVNVDQEVWYDANEEPNDAIQEAQNESQVPLFCSGFGMVKEFTIK